MLGIFSEHGVETALRLKSEGEITWESFQDQSCQPSAFTQFGVSRRPANFLIDQSGIVRHVNVFDPATLKTHINKMLNENASQGLASKDIQ